MKFSEAMFYENYLTSPGSPYKHCYFKKCLPIQNGVDLLRRLPGGKRTNSVRIRRFRDKIGLKGYTERCNKRIFENEIMFSLPLGYNTA